MKRPWTTCTVRTTVGKWGTPNAPLVEKEKEPINGENQDKFTPYFPEETYDHENEEILYEETYAEFDDEAYDKEADEESTLYAGYDEDYPDQENPEYEEAYATYLDARRRFAELRNNRGFFPRRCTDGEFLHTDVINPEANSEPSQRKRRKRKRSQITASKR